MSRTNIDHDRLLIEKSEIIKDLSEKLELAQKRLAKNIAETSTQGYANVKAMHNRLQQDQEHYATELIGFQGEIDKLKATLKQKVTNM